MANPVVLPGNLSPEQLQLFSLMLQGMAQNNSNTANSSPGKFYFYARVTVSCSEPGCDDYTTSHEVVKFENVSSVSELIDTMRNTFTKVQKGDHKARNNVSFSEIPTAGSGENGDTVITDLNYEIVFAMMADRKSTNSMSVTISTRN
ncbi:hypothetical protein IFR05_013233 [Cadophora sp. M221]|nr:hypothetical protein IFR05_013233 [Cadophora sp. M221]